MRLALLAPLVALQWALFAAILLAFLLGRRIIEARMRVAIGCNCCALT